MSSTPLTLSPSHQAGLEPYLPPLATSNTANSPSRYAPLPHLTLTYATSLDASISLGPGIQTLLSGAETKAMTHFLRSRHDAILVGVGTAETDDPGLNCRFSEDGRTIVGLERQPIPIILDPSARWSCEPDAKVLKLARERMGKPPIWLIDELECDGEGTNADSRLVEERVADLRAVGGEMIGEAQYVQYHDGATGVDWPLVLRVLADKGIKSLMVEGGAKVIEDLLRGENQGYVSSVIITTAPVWLGKGGVTVCPTRNAAFVEAGRLKNVKWLPMGEDVVMAGKFGRRT
jgi:2,5-diamino-6-(ribosylamino)-4(3H)-pyrimidinone 5'-phosphate reductase